MDLLSRLPVRGFRIFFPGDPFPVFHPTDDPSLDPGTVSDGEKGKEQSCEKDEDHPWYRKRDRLLAQKGGNQ